MNICIIIWEFHFYMKSFVHSNAPQHTVNTLGRIDALEAGFGTTCYRNWCKKPGVELCCSKMRFGFQFVTEYSSFCSNYHFPHRALPHTRHSFNTCKPQTTEQFYYACRHLLLPGFNLTELLVAKVKLRSSVTSSFEYAHASYKAEACALCKGLLLAKLLQTGYGLKSRYWLLVHKHAYRGILVADLTS